MLSAPVAMYVLRHREQYRLSGSGYYDWRQAGLITSCFLFIIFVNDLIELIKEKCPPDVFLEKFVHSSLTGDAVLMATSRQRVMHKIARLQPLCNSYGKTMNEGTLDSL